MDSENSSPSSETVQAFREELETHLYHYRGQPLRSASLRDAHTALCYTIRDRLTARFSKTAEAFYREKPKFVAYLSAEYLPGQQLSNNLLYTGVTELAAQALAHYGLGLEQLLALDEEPALGNGGLGRLAACYLDSAATLGFACVGYGIRYEFGIFRQSFQDGWQVEGPDKWLHFGNPWEFPQPDEMVKVGFGGHTEPYTDSNGHYHPNWIPGETILGEPVLQLVPGYGNQVANPFRLWRARASHEFDFHLFDVGDYARAVEQKVRSENISKVLYPNDSTPQGKELRLRQQYFFVACSLHDVIRLFRLREHDWDRFPEQVAIQLNDTHPVLAIPELMRLLVDVHHLGWDQSWQIVSRSIASTQHTLLPESLERWPISLFRRLLPRHLEIIYEINHRFLDEVRERFPGDGELVARLSIIEEGAEQRVRMANLACVGSFSINGVAELQSRLLRERVMPEFAKIWPEKFNNKTNGVTPRRFMQIANPRLSHLIASKIGGGWLNDLNQLKQLEPLTDDLAFVQAWRDVKQGNKRDLADWIVREMGITVDPESLFDVMVKRLHEYKRQLLKVLHILTLYNRLRAGGGEMQPRTFLFGAKAAPGYHAAKLIIKLINNVAQTINNDPAVGYRLRVVFVPNFNVSLGERIYPAADISEQISLAGKEASGTGNMKFALNGALTVGTLDGANIEIRDRVGDENFFAFGMTAAEVQERQAHGYRALDHYESNADLKHALDMLVSGVLSPEDPGLFRPLYESLLYNDEYLLLADYQAYIDVQDRAEAAYKDADGWTRKSILNTARCGFFSSDRAVEEYRREIWQADLLDVTD